MHCKHQPIEDLKTPQSGFWSYSSKVAFCLQARQYEFIFLCLFDLDSATVGPSEEKVLREKTESIKILMKNAWTEHRVVLAKAGEDNELGNAWSKITGYPV